MKYKITITTEAEAHCQKDAELMAFDKIGLGYYNIDSEEIEEKRMTQKKCKKCQRVIIEDWLEYLKKYPNEHELECPYCGYVEKIC